MLATSTLPVSLQLAAQPDTCRYDDGRDESSCRRSVVRAMVVLACDPADPTQGFGWLTVQRAEVVSEMLTYSKK